MSALLAIAGLAAVGYGAYNSAMVPIVEEGRRQHEQFKRQPNYSVKNEQWAQAIAYGEPCLPPAEKLLPNPKMDKATYRVDLRNITFPDVKDTLDPHSALDNMAVYATTENGYNDTWLRVQTW